MNSEESSDPVHVADIETLAESEHTKVVFARGDSEYLLVTFSPMRQAGEHEAFWADKFALKNRITTLSFVAKQAHWYPNVDTRRLIRKIRPELPRQLRRVLYGFSMGGYAALKFSKLLDADVVLAFSPQFSIDPNEIDDERFRANFRPYNRRMSIEAADLSTRSMIVFDRMHTLDRLNALLIRKQQPSTVALLPVRYADHATVNLVLGSDILKRVIALTQQRPLQAKRSIAALLHSQRKQSPMYYASLGKRLHASGRHELATRVLALASERSPKSALAISVSASAVAKTDLEAAIQMLEGVDSPRALRTLAGLYMKAGNLQHAAECLARAEQRSNKRPSIDQPLNSK